MSQNNTAGFDLLVQISEAELNNQAAAAFAAGTLLAPEVVSPFSFGGATGQASLNLRTPVIDLDRPRPNIGITIPFADSQLQITSPLPMTVAPLAGSILVVDRVQVRTFVSRQQAVVDFTDGAPNVTVTLSAASQALLAPLLAAAGITLDQALNQFAEGVRQRLVNDIQRIPLTPEIPVNPGNEDPLSLNGFEVGTVNDASAADRDALVFGLRTSSATGGNINLITTSFIPGGSSAVLMFANNWLLFRVIRPFLATALGVNVSAFDQPCTLNRSVPFQDGTLTNLTAAVVGNRIRVQGRATASGTGWSAVSNFTFFIDLALSGGEITVTSSTPVVHTDVDLEWWVWLVSLGLGGLFGGIVGAIVAAIVLAIVEAVAEGVADNLIADGISDATSNIPSLPLGPIGAALSAGTLLLDDLELRGSIIRSHAMPVKHSGALALSSGFSLNLDDGQVSNLVPAHYGMDLSWNAASGITAGSGAGIQILGSSYGSIGHTDLEKYGYPTSFISAGTIPVFLPLFGPPELVFGVFTNEGRYAKVAVRREISGALRIRYTTYDRPVPKLEIGAAWEVTEQGEGLPFISGKLAPCTRYDVARRGVIEALPRLMAYPVDYQFCLCGTVLTEGGGDVDSPSGSIPYELSGRRLILKTSLGQAVNCELCVSAIDARGREFFTCVHLELPPQEQKCGKPKRFLPKRTIEFIPCDPLIGLSQWEAVSNPIFNAHLERALANPVSLAQAAKGMEEAIGGLAQKG